MCCRRVGARIRVPNTIKVRKFSSVVGESAPDVDLVLPFESFLVSSTAALVVYMREILQDVIFAVQVC